MFNHRSDAQSDVSFNYFKNQFELVINKQYNINEQIYISYGKPSNDRLLQYYGFIEYNNPYDIYDYSNNIIDLLLKYSDNIEKKLKYPIYPDPSIRIQLIYIALKNTKVLSQLVSNKKEVTMSPPTSSSSSSTSSSTTSTGKEEKPLRYYSSPIDGSTNDNDDTTTSGNIQSPSKNQHSPSENQRMQFTRHYDDVSVRCLRLFFASESEWTLIQRAWKLDTTDLNTILATTTTSTTNNNINTNNIDLEIVGKPLSDETESNIQQCLRIIAESELYDKPTTISQDLELLQILRKKSASKSGTGPAEKTGFGQPKTKGLSGTALAAASVLQSGGELNEQILAVEFRIEKKKLLQRAMEI